jgi:hypothetical protein
MRPCRRHLLVNQLLQMCTHPPAIPTTEPYPQPSNLLLLLILRRTLRLRRASEFLQFILPLFALLSAGLLDLGSRPDSHLSVTWFEFLHCLGRVVDECKSSALPTTVVCPHAEDIDLVFVCLVRFREFAAELIFGNICAVWVEDITVKIELEYALCVFSLRLSPQTRETYTTICFLLRSLLVMNLRVRSVTCWSDMIAVLIENQFCNQID